MSSLLKTITLLNRSFIYINYKKTTINVIIICFLFILSGCTASEKAEKERRDHAYRSISLIPPTQEKSEYFETRFEKNPPPEYPFETKK